MHVTPVDPRDASWEVDQPAYRVYFWRRPQTAHDMPVDQVMWWSDEYEITGADIDEVLAWTHASAGPHGLFTLWVVSRHGGELGLIRLLGFEPTTTGADRPSS